MARYEIRLPYALSENLADAFPELTAIQVAPASTMLVESRFSVMASSMPWRMPVTTTVDTVASSSVCALVASAS